MPDFANASTYRVQINLAFSFLWLDLCWRNRIINRSILWAINMHCLNSKTTKHTPIDPVCFCQLGTTWSNDYDDASSYSLACKSPAGLYSKGLLVSLLNELQVVVISLRQDFELLGRIGQEQSKRKWQNLASVQLISTPTIIEAFCARTRMRWI